MSNARIFIILLSGESLTSFNKNERVDLSGGKDRTKLPGMSIFLRIHEKTFRQISCPKWSSPWNQRSLLTDIITTVHLAPGLNVPVLPPRGSSPSFFGEQVKKDGAGKGRICHTLNRAKGYASAPEVSFY